MSYTQGLGALPSLAEQAAADDRALTDRLLATLRGGQPQMLPEIQVRASPLPMILLLAGLAFLFFGGAGRGRYVW